MTATMEGLLIETIRLDVSRRIVTDANRLLGLRLKSERRSFPVLHISLRILKQARREGEELKTTS